MHQSVNAETGKKIQELQVFEQQLQQGALQKQTVQVELNEVINALTEISKTKDEVYRLIGGIMVRADQELLAKELTEKKRILEIRIQALEKQETLIEDKIKKLREEINLVVKAIKK